MLFAFILVFGAFRILNGSMLSVSEVNFLRGRDVLPSGLGGWI